MNVRLLMKRAQIALERNPKAELEIHLSRKATGATIHLQGPDKGPVGSVVATGASGTIARFSAREILDLFEAPISVASSR